MNFERTVPRGGDIRLSQLSEGEYAAFAEIMRYYASGAWSATVNHSEASIRMARNILAGLGKLEV